MENSINFLKLFLKPSLKEGLRCVTVEMNPGPWSTTPSVTNPVLETQATSVEDTPLPPHTSLCMGLEGLSI